MTATRAGSKATGLAMAFKLIMTAQSRWRAVNVHPDAFARAGAGFINGKLAERSQDQRAVTPPAETSA